MKISKFLYVIGVLLILGFTSKSQIKTDSNTKNNSNKMTTLTTYLLLDGTCKQAMEFYKSVFGGELAMTSVSNSPMKSYFPEVLHNRIVNAKLKSPMVEISASDWLRPNQTPIQGNMVCMYLSGGTPEEIKNLFNKLSDGANITDPLVEQPFGIYGALNDKFGVRWMFHAENK